MLTTLLRGMMIGLVVNLSLVASVRAEDPTPPEEAMFLTAESSKQLIKSLLDDVSAWQQSQGVVDGGVSKSMSDSGAVMTALFGEESPADEYVFEESGSMTGVETVTATIAGQSAQATGLESWTIDFEAGSAPAPITISNFKGIGVRFATMSFVVAVFSTGLDTRVVQGIEFGARTESDGMKYVFVAVADVTDQIGSGNQSINVSPGDVAGVSWWACTTAALAAAAALTICFACTAGCVAITPAGLLTCSCALKACCAGLFGILATLRLCRGPSNALDEAMIVVGAVCGTITIFASETP